MTVDRGWRPWAIHMRSPRSGFKNFETTAPHHFSQPSSLRCPSDDQNRRSRRQLDDPNPRPSFRRVPDTIQSRSRRPPKSPNEITSLMSALEQKEEEIHSPPFVIVPQESSGGKKQTFPSQVASFLWEEVVGKTQIFERWVALVRMRSGRFKPSSSSGFPHRLLKPETVPHRPQFFSFPNQQQEELSSSDAKHTTTTLSLTHLLDSTHGRSNSKHTLIVQQLLDRAVKPSGVGLVPAVEGAEVARRGERLDRGKLRDVRTPCSRRNRDGAEPYCAWRAIAEPGNREGEQSGRLFAELIVFGLMLSGGLRPHQAGFARLRTGFMLPGGLRPHQAGFARLRTGFARLRTGFARTRCSGLSSAA
ncbi:hypothetical protein KSP39_PZI010326 [Platanthera zijinensis]|uniref:Uncharacterized protein n=1 Tax=Platanthera zijinensis TaxID=2320716 RepID=A0AAP0BJV4_9ASPA